jgi:hypothetical protein
MNNEVSAKEPVRLITMVWGDSYCERLIEFTLPSILAPGNLPALAIHFDCELAIVTESRLVKMFEASDVVKRIKNFAKVKYVYLDDLVEGVSGYGMALTYALHRGFDDLSPEVMTNTFLVFFNADFILADDSYKSMAQHMLKGERLIFSPSYCVVAEEVLPQLQANFDPETQTIAIPKRSMAFLGIAYRHNTVRSKVINQQRYHMHVTDQLYWMVDDTTMLGRQLPIAIVCMKPQKPYTDPLCFWDYATISEACPTANRCVLGDSDDFMMIELRDRTTLGEHMKIGRISAKEIGVGLGNYMTVDQFEMGKYPLVLHCADLPENVEEEQTKLKKFVDEVYRYIPKKPISYIDHRFWVGQVRDYEAEKEQRRGARKMAGYMQMLTDAFQVTKPQLETGAEIYNVTEETARANTKIAKTRGGKIYQMLFGSSPRVKMLHPLWSDLNRVVKRIDEVTRRRKPHVFMLMGGGKLLEPIIDTIPCTYVKCSVIDFIQDDIPKDAGKFDLCICELDWLEGNQFKSIYSIILSHMKPGAKILVYLRSGVLRTLQPSGAEALNGIFPLYNIPEFSMNGSRESAFISDEYQRRLDAMSVVAPNYSRQLKNLAIYLLKNAPRTLRVNWRTQKIPDYEVGDMRTSLIMELDVK